MGINASPIPAYPYVIVDIESDDYGTSGISVVRSSTQTAAVSELTIGGRTAGELFDADDGVFKEAVNIVDGDEAKLMYHINGESTERVSLEFILGSEVHSKTFAAMLRHDTIYNAVLAKRAAEKAAQDAAEKTKAEQADHYVMYYRYAAEDAAPVSADQLVADTYDNVKAKVIGTNAGELGLSETEAAAYKAFAENAGNTGKDPVLGKYAVKFTHGSGATPYNAEAIEIPSPVPDFENLEVCLPITIQ